MTNGTIAPRGDRYTTVAIWFHWIIAGLVLFNLIVGLFHESVPALRALMGVHMAVGLLVLVLTVGRIAWRVSHPVPALPSDVPAWERPLAHIARWAFYILLLLMPLTGWAMVSGGSHAHPVDWFGLFKVPMLPVDGAVASASHETHGLAGYLFAALVVVHIAAALRHHFVLKNRVLSRMLPRFLAS